MESCLEDLLKFGQSNGHEIYDRQVIDLIAITHKVFSIEDMVKIALLRNELVAC
jgi:hypothetical protein